MSAETTTPTNLPQAAKPCSEGPSTSPSTSSGPRAESGGGGALLQGKPPRTWRPMVGWTLGILTALGLAWFVGAVAVPVWQVRRVAERYYQPHDTDGPADTPLEGIRSLGGTRRAAQRLRNYMSLPDWAAPNKFQAGNLLFFCGSDGKNVILGIIEDRKSSELYELMAALDVMTLGNGPPKACLEVLADREVLIALATLMGDAEHASLAAIIQNAIQSAGSTNRVTIPVLVRYLKHRESGVRLCSLEALLSMGPLPESASLDLCSLLGDEEPVIRERAAWALGSTGPAAVEAIPALEKLLQDKEDFVRQAAAQALKKIRGEEPPK